MVSQPGQGIPDEDECLVTFILRSPPPRLVSPFSDIARVLFCTTSEHLVLLHGFVKKTQRTPTDDIDLALSRMRELNA